MFESPFTRINLDVRLSTCISVEPIVLFQFESFVVVHVVHTQATCVRAVHVHFSIGQRDPAQFYLFCANSIVMPACLLPHVFNGRRFSSSRALQQGFSSLLLLTSRRPAEFSRSLHAIRTIECLSLELSHSAKIHVVHCLL